MQINRVMIAAAGSGSGKTTVTCALLQAMSESGVKTAAFKCGPDYIDPLFHQKAIGIPSKNLDPFFTDEGKVRVLFQRAAKDSEIAVIEGVMGLYDGLGGIKEEASSYQLAKMLETPIVLVINGHGMGRSLLALIAGFLAYDTAHLIKGVILNRVGSVFYERIKPEIEANLPVRVLGHLPDTKELRVESRHLGLKLPGELPGIRERIKRAAELLKECVDLNLLSQIAEAAPAWTPLCLKRTSFEAFIPKKKIPIGIAMDEAFCFYYEDNIKLLEQLGAELRPFSPMRDKTLPKGIRGLILGGGYPELHGDALSRNQSMKNAVKEAIKRKLPSIAECGGFLYLHEEMNTGDRVCKMAGAIKANCFMTEKLVRFGYVELQEKRSCFLEPEGRIRGHEFHYFDSTSNGADCLAVKPVSGAAYACIHETKESWWGFAHLYYESNPRYAVHFMERAAAYETV